MGNTKHTPKSIMLSANEVAYTVADLLTKVKESDAEAIAALENIQEVGRNKGVIYTPKSGSVITFDKYEDSVIVVRASTFNDNLILQLNVIAVDAVIGDVELPIAIFRRKPALKEDLEALMKNKFTAQLLQNYIGDLKRLEMLSGKSWKVSISIYARRKFVKDPKTGRMKEDDVSKIPVDAREMQEFYVLSPAS